MGNSALGVARVASGAFAAIVLFGACSAMGGSEDSADLGNTSSALASDGPWAIPADVSEIGDTQFVDYTGAGPWTGTESCQGGMTTGAAALRTYLYEYFPQLTLVGGYACRAINGNPSQTSVHATGRALDLHIPLAADGAADNDLGDPIAHWLIRNSESMGIQFIIWDRSSWNASRAAGEKFRPYGGASPHRDHLHIELSVPAGAAETSWFSEEKTAPLIAECDSLGAEGGILDDLDGCTQILGPTAYWRHEVSEGFAESLFWTNAIDSEEASNWARWHIGLEEAGQYELEVFVTPDFALHQAARYELIHANEVVNIEIDQSAADGWHSMGIFDFAAGREQYLALFDNSDQEVGEGQRIVADAIRLTRIDIEEPEPEEPDSDEPAPGPGDLTGGCQSGGGKSSGLGMLLMAFALLNTRRRVRSGSNKA